MEIIRRFRGFATDFGLLSREGTLVAIADFDEASRGADFIPLLESASAGTNGTTGDRMCG